MTQTVWQLVRTSSDWTCGVFSSPENAVTWLRKSRQFMHDTGGPIVPMPEGACFRLNERFLLVPSEVDPSPLSDYDMAPFAGSEVPG
jgi:hypothetical protein